MGGGGGFDKRKIFDYVMQKLQNSLPSLPPLTLLVDEEVGNVADYLEFMGEACLGFLDLKTAGLFVLRQKYFTKLLCLMCK